MASPAPSASRPYWPRSCSFEQGQRGRATGLRGRPAWCVGGAQPGAGIDSADRVLGHPGQRRRDDRALAPGDLEQVGPPYDDRLINQLLPGTPAGVESANRAGIPEIYDPRTNTIYVGPKGVADPSQRPRLSRGPRRGTYRLSVPGSHLHSIVITAAQARLLRAGKLDLAFRIGPAGRPVRLGLIKARAAKPRHTAPTVTADPFSPQFRTQIKALIHSGRLHVVGPVVVHGRQAIEIASADRHLVYDVAVNTYRPLEFDTRGTTGGVDIFISTYRVLPGRGSSALLSLRAQHPDATIDRNVADYNRAQSRLFPHG